MRTRYYKNNNGKFFKIEKHPDKRYKTGYKYILYQRVNWGDRWFYKRHGRCVNHARLGVRKLFNNYYVDWQDMDYRNYLQPITKAEAELIMAFEE